MPPSSEYEGLPVRKHSVAVRGASGDALNGSLKVEPREFHPGERAFMVLEVVPADVNHKPMDEGDAWERVQVVRVARGTFVDAKTALPYLDAMSVALEDLRVKETGQERLDIETKMTDDHLAGLHKRPKKQCQLCQARDPLGVGDVTPIGASIDQVVAQAEAAGAGDGEGDPDNPLPPARTYRKRPSRAKGAKKQPKQTSTKT